MSAHIVYSDKLGERVDQWGVKSGLNFGRKKERRKEISAVTAECS